MNIKNAIIVILAFYAFKGVHAEEPKIVRSQLVGRWVTGNSVAVFRDNGTFMLDPKGATDETSLGSWEVKGRDLILRWRLEPRHRTARITALSATEMTTFTSGKSVTWTRSSSAQTKNAPKQAAPASPTPNGTQARLSTSSANVPVTPGSERFDVKGLKVGAGPSVVAAFLRENGLRAKENYTFPGEIRGTDTVAKIEYVESQNYTNDKSGLGEVRLELHFTPPFPGPEGVASLVSSITYASHFGEGLSLNEVMDDVLRKYGSENIKQTRPGFGPGDQLNWEILGDDRFLQLQATAFVTPSSSVGKPGELQIMIIDHFLRKQATRLAKEHLDKVEETRPKDTTKPDF